MEDNSTKHKSSKRRAPASDDRKEAYREKVRINEQKRRSRAKEYFATLKSLLPINANREDMTKEEILQQTIQLLENRRESDVPKLVPLSQNEVSELFVTVHRDAFYKIASINSHSKFDDAKNTLNYLSDLSDRSDNLRLKIHAGMSQIALHAFIFYNPALCNQIYDTLIPIYDSFIAENEVYRLELNLGNSEWVLPSYALVLASQGKFDKSFLYEKRALQLAAARPETAGHIYACLYFIRYFRGEKLSIKEAVDVYHAMKEIPHLKDYAQLAFGYGLLQQSSSISDTMESKAIIDNAQDAIHACPFFEFHLRGMFIECMEVLNPERALVDVDTAMVLREIKGKSGCFTKADYSRMKADTLLKIPTEEFNLVKAEELYKEAIAISSSEGLYSCTLKAATALCKLYKAQQRRSDWIKAGRFLMELVSQLERENELPCVLLKNANAVLRDFIDFK